MNKQDYITEAERQLSDTTFYKSTDTDQTQIFKKKVFETLITLAKNKKITDKMATSLQALSPVPGRFYMLPKIHKEGNPGRPIISGIGTVTEKISSFIDSLIKDIPPTLPSYVKDTNHFLADIIDLVIPDGSLLVTLDVASLYTNIPHSDGIRSVIQAYDNASEDNPVDSETLGVLLELVLKLNNFEFNNAHYVQINGTSMGTKIGPNYANIFMGTLESEFLSSAQLHPLFYRRFIDDIFLIWCHGEEELKKFITAFNNAHENISFSHTYSASTINFLDVTVKISDNKLVTSVYRKPTDRHQYLHFKSSHVKHCKLGIPYSQSLRFRRICSDPDDFASNCQQLKNDLTRQQYPLSAINDAFKKSEKQDRRHLITNTKAKSLNTTPNLILTYSASPPNVNSILRKHHNILLQSDRLRSVP